MPQPKAAVVLAGGNGNRLLSLTRVVTGDDRPKQFCPILGGRTLLDETLDRLTLNVPRRSTFTVVTRVHERFYRESLGAAMEPYQLIEQPEARGTAAGVAYGLSRVRRTVGDNALVGFFPADHSFANARALARTVDRAYAEAAQHPDRIYLLGAKPTVAETEYGWIECERSTATTVFGESVSRRALGFWEKPSRAVALQLMGRACLWNTFIFIATVKAMRELFDRHLPQWTPVFEPLARPVPDESAAAADAYAAIEAADFSSDVLQKEHERLYALELADAGWTDLGQPSRVMAMLRSRGLTLPQLHAAS